jgi:cell division septum initiation protein DivIVA
MIRIGAHPMLLNSTQVIPRSQHEDESALLRFKIDELNRNTVRLIAEAEKLIQESKQLSTQIKSFENSAAKPKWSPSAHY